MRMQDCTKFDHCSAPVCPLDTDYKARSTLRGEPVCLWLGEYAKDTNMAVLSSTVHAELYPRVAECYKHVLGNVGYSDIRYRLKKASESKSKISQYKERFHE